jgi:hypothetical protein
MDAPPVPMSKRDQIWPMPAGVGAWLEMKPAPSRPINQAPQSGEYRPNRIQRVMQRVELPDASGWTH